MDRKKKVSYIILGLIIVAQVCTMIYLFQYKKEGFHSDDSYDYGFANANHEQWIDSDGPRIKNFNEWKSGDVFRSFIQVQEGHEFDYETAMYNMSDDYIPPLYSLILHTVCSFFPDTFSWWYAFGINLVAFAVMILFTYKSLFEITNHRIVSLMGSAFLGFTGGAINMNLFLKGYILLASIAVAILYLHMKVWEKKDYCMKELIGIAMLYVLGFLINYEMYFLGLCMTAVCGIFFLANKKIKLAFIYGFLVIIAVLVAIIIWPRTLEMLQSNTTDLYGKNMPFSWELNFCTLLLTTEALGIPVQIPDIVFLTYAKWIVVYIIAISGGLCFLFRNEIFFKKIKLNIKQKLKVFAKKCKDFAGGSSIMSVLLLPVVVGTLLLVIKTCNIYVMGQFSDRYLFFLEPLLFIMFYSMLYFVVRLIVKNKKLKYSIISVLLIALMIMNHWLLGSFYYFPTDYGKEPIVSATRDSNVIVVTGLRARLIYYSTALRECGHFLALQKREDISSCLPKIAEKDICKVDYLLIETADLRGEDWVEEYDEDGNEVLTAEEKLKKKYKLSDVVAEYINQGYAGDAKVVMNVKCQYGNLALLKFS